DGKRIERGVYIPQAARLRGLVENRDDTGEGWRTDRGAAHRCQASIAGTKSGSTACRRGRVGSKKSLRTDQRRIVVRRCGQGNVRNIAMAVNWSQGRLPRGLGKYRAHAAASGGKPSAVCYGESRIIPGHFRNISEGRTDYVGGIGRACPEW